MTTREKDCDMTDTLRDKIRRLVRDDLPATRAADEHAGDVAAAMVAASAPINVAGIIHHPFVIPTPPQRLPAQSRTKNTQRRRYYLSLPLRQIGAGA